MHIAQSQKVKRKINLLYCELKNVKINYHVVFLRKVWVDMFGGSWMDTFMDKLAQKFTAQEMIKANSAAEAAELQRTREQVKKYNDCLQEMKQVNDDTKAALVQIQETLEAGMDQFKNAEIPLEGLSNEIMDFVHKENVKVYRNVQAVVVEEGAKQAEGLEVVTAKVNAVKGKASAAFGMSIVTFILVLCSVIMQVLDFLNISLF